MTSAKRATAVVVTYESADYISQCLEALETDGGADLDIIVVDNNSRDGTAGLVRQRFPDVALRVTHRNLGYGAAANIGIGLATGDPIMILNADAVVEPGTLAALRARLDSDLRLGCVSPVHVTPDGERLSPARAFPSIGAAIADGTMLERWLRGSAVLRAYYREDASLTMPPEWLDGACLAFRDRALQQVGGFDATFFMYAEELDLQRSLHQAGWICAIEETVRVRHSSSASASRELAVRERNFSRSRYRLAGKMWGRPFAIFLRLFVASINLVRLAEQLVNLPLASGRSTRAREARHIAQVTVWQWFGWRH